MADKDLFLLKIVKVIKVVDGDTVHVVDQDGKIYKVRVVGIDAPEISQEYGKQSRDALLKILTSPFQLDSSDSAMQGDVILKIEGKDHFQRTLGKLFVIGLSLLPGNPVIIDVQKTMLQTGNAWHYSTYDQTEAYGIAMLDAQNNQRGLWGHSQFPIAPSVYRKEQREKRKKKKTSSSLSVADKNQKEINSKSSDININRKKISTKAISFVNNYILLIKK